MVAGVVTVGRNRYAIGLYWENSPGSGRVAQIAKEAARQPGQQADFYAVRPGNKDGRIPQFGLSSSESGQAAGMPVLAACLAGQIPGSWAGAFRVHEGFVITIVRDDLIVPDGDLYFVDEAEARDRLLQEISFGGLQTVYAPEAWSIPGADTIPLTLVLNDRRDIHLQRVVIPQRVKVITAGLAVFFILLVMGLWYRQVQIDEENARLAQIEAQRLAEQRSHLPEMLQSAQPPPPKYERKWETAPTVLAVLDDCRQGLAKIEPFVAGWKIDSVRCSGNVLTLIWSREQGMSTPPPGSSVNDTGAQATQVVVLPDISARGSENLLDVDDVTKRFLLQNWPGTVGRISDDPLPPPPPGYTGPWAPPPPPWVKRSFTLTVPELPGGLARMIGDLPGAVINAMSYSPGSSGSWVVEGVIYENRK